MSVDFYLKYAVHHKRLHKLLLVDQNTQRCYHLALNPSPRTSVARLRACHITLNLPSHRTAQASQGYARATSPLFFRRIASHKRHKTTRATSHLIFHRIASHKRRKATGWETAGRERHSSPLTLMFCGVRPARWAAMFPSVVPGCRITSDTTLRWIASK
eukprot:132658-Pyramimonas_sp.AAC.2